MGRMLERLGIWVAMLTPSAFLIWEAWGDHGRSWVLMVNLWMDAMAVVILWILLSGRTRVVGDAYAHGYRQGREDANNALLECALVSTEEVSPGSRHDRR